MNTRRVTIDNPPESTPALGIYVLTFNGLHILKDCLPSALDQGHVVIVDNGSSDGTRAYCLEQWPMVTVVCREENVGLGTALNAAVAAVPARNIILMNNDVHVIGDALRHLSALLDSDTSVGQAAPELLNPDGSVQEFGNDLGLTGLPAVPRHVSRPLFETFFQAGCVTAMRRDEFLGLGGYSEFFEWFFEDVDLAWRYRNAGLRVLVDDRSRCIHMLGATLGHASREQVCLSRSTPAQRRRIYYSTRNVLLMFGQNAPWYQALLQVPFILVRQGIEALSFFAAGDTEMVHTYRNAWLDAVTLLPRALGGASRTTNLRSRRTSTLRFVQIEASKMLSRLLELIRTSYRRRA